MILINFLKQQIFLNYRIKINNHLVNVQINFLNRINLIRILTVKNNLFLKEILIHRINKVCLQVIRWINLILFLVKKISLNKNLKKLMFHNFKKQEIFHQKVNLNNKVHLINQKISYRINHLNKIIVQNLIIYQVDHQMKIIKNFNNHSNLNKLKNLNKKKKNQIYFRS